MLPARRSYDFDLQPLRRRHHLDGVGEARLRRDVGAEDDGEAVVFRGNGPAATAYTNAGRIAYGTQSITDLRFGTLGKSMNLAGNQFDPEAVRRYTGKHTVARHILLALSPPPGNPKHFEVDHINEDKTDDRLCNLQ